MKLFIAGQKHFGAMVFALCQHLGHQVVGVSSPAFRGYDQAIPVAFSDGTEKPDRLRALADQVGVPWMEAGQLRAETLPEGVDLIIAAHSADFIGRKTRAKARLGAVGYHPSLLPRHRGRDAIRWALKMGDPITGGSVFWLDDNVDGGPIAAQEWCWVHPGDTATSLWRRDLQPIGLRLIERVLADISAGRLVMLDQEQSVATWEPSWERQPIFRPELPALGIIPGFEVIKSHFQ